MSDKDVGELWARVQFTGEEGDGDWLHKKIVQAVIRKLVEERARWRELTNSRCVGPCAENEARRDFGIDPATWEEK